VAAFLHPQLRSQARLFRAKREPDIVLTTLNAKYIHAAFGLRYLLANLGELKSRACLVEFDINQRPLDIAEFLLTRNPKIIGFGIYIWNVGPTTEVIAAMKRLRPDIKIILGGPEVSYETEQQEIVKLADHVITGEADLKFAEVCRVLLGRVKLPRVPAVSAVSKEQFQENPLTRRNAALSPIRRERWARGPSDKLGFPEESMDRAGEGFVLPKIIPAELPEFAQLTLPYDLYTDDDIAHRIIYVEASRGCPFTCEFCLSSLDIPVRQVPLPALLGQLQRLLDRGVKQFKFVDRTFNLNVNVSKTILEFFLARYRPGHFFHFEMIPDRLPESLREIIAKFPPGALQFEVGIQTFNEKVSHLISRKQNYEKLADNFHFLRGKTGVHIHADLIVGLPGETLESLAAGFNQLIALDPQEIQVGILKRLRGTPIVRHDVEWQMVYNPHPPYEILQNKLIDFTTMQKLRRFARYWDLIGNSGNFVETTPLIWSSGGKRFVASPFSQGQGTDEAAPSIDRQNTPSPRPSTTKKRVDAGRERRNFSPFHAFLHFSEWLYGRTGRTDSIALVRLMELLFEFLTDKLQLDRQPVSAALWRDYQRGGRRDKPGFLRNVLPADEVLVALHKTTLPKRQARRLA
jgi:radical SAM superfamily enzyme YgiQ (UPF0313 family)